MYSTIIIDCQTKKTNFSCEDCIAYKTCRINNNTNQTENTAKSAPLQIIINGGAAAPEKTLSSAAPNR